MDRPLTLRRILEEHPTGRLYGPIVASERYFPLLTDSAGKVLSMPPVINCRDLGEVSPKDTDFFVDVTGTDQNVVMLTANIIAADFADRLSDLDKDTPYFVYCRSGNRSATTIDMMRDLGFTEVYELDGGIASWAAAGLPIQ